MNNKGKAAYRFLRERCIKITHRRNFDNDNTYSKNNDYYKFVSSEDKSLIYGAFIWKAASVRFWSNIHIKWVSFYKREYGGKE